MVSAHGVLDTDVCIIGAGPHGLAARLLFKRLAPSTSVTVIDRSYDWLAAWNRQFEHAQIDVLRSPIVHHPFPDALELENFRIRNSYTPSGLPYNPPTTKCFTAFCSEIIRDADLDDPLIAEPQLVQTDPNGIELTTSHGEIRARNLIIATNPHTKVIPHWAQGISLNSSLVKHASDVNLAGISKLEGQSITVIGGGMTAAHLARGAVFKGASVKMISRRQLQVRNFDTDPGWLGPKYLSDYYSEKDAHKRIQKALEARGGGTIPPWIHSTLLDLAKSEAIEILESMEVISVQPKSSKGCILTLRNEKEIYSDQVWLATGTCSSLQSMECLRPILENVSFIDGFPIVDSSLRLKPHPVYIMGRSATYALGPASGNLWGATRAAHRITRDITGVELISNGT